MTANESEPPPSTSKNAWNVSASVQLNVLRVMYRVVAWGAVPITLAALRADTPKGSLYLYAAVFPVVLWGIFSKRARPVVLAVILVAILFVFAVALLVTVGMPPGAFVGLSCAIFTAALLLGTRAAIATTLLSFASVVTVGYCHSRHWLPSAPAAAVDVSRFSVWVRAAMAHMFQSSLLAAGATLLLRSYRDAIGKSLAANRELERLQAEREAAQARERQYEQRARDTERIEALGRLAAGVAHDFNNSLLVMQTWADVLGENTARDPDVLEAVAAIREACARSADLTRQLLAFGRQEPYAPRPTDLVALVTRLKQTLARVLPKNIEIHVIETGVVNAAWTDPSQLEHVLMNLALNARDAMPSGGTLSFVVDRPEPHELEGLEGKEYVAVRVRDSGIGIPKNVLPRIFEPFFTTKGPTQGTGLGLSSAYGVVRSHGGQLTVMSELGQGATFTLALPSVPATMAASRMRTGCAVLLLCSDARRRSEISQHLRAAGHRVQEASTPRQALELVRRARQALDALVAEADAAPVVDVFRTQFPGAPVALLGDEKGALGGTPSAELVASELSISLGAAQR